LVQELWRYQRGNQNPYIEEEQTTQWPKEKVQKEKQRSTKRTYKTKDRVTRTPLKTRGELRGSGRVSSSCYTREMQSKYGNSERNMSLYSSANIKTMGSLVEQELLIILCVVFCRSLFVFLSFLLTIVFSVLWCTASDYPFYIFILLLNMAWWCCNRIRSCEFESRAWRGVLDTPLSDKVCQWLAADRWFFERSSGFLTNKTDRHDITEILL
jgi:hypothetical protein